MELNPYESPAPPEEPVAFREVGAVWIGWKRVRQVGVVLGALSIGVMVLGYMGGVRFSPISSLVLLAMFAVSVVCALAGRVGAYFNTVVNMFRGDYD